MLMNGTLDPVCRAVADPTRRRILELLTRGDCSVLRLVDEFAMSQPAVSQHLKVLKEAGLVSVRKDGRKRFYGLNSEPLREVYDWIGHFQHFWDSKLDRLEQYLEESP